MLTYTFSFTSHAAGQEVTVSTYDGTTVATGTAASTPDETGAYIYSATLPEGAYIGTAVTNEGGTLSTVGQFDIGDSIDGAVSTGPAYFSYNFGDGLAFGAFHPGNWIALEDGRAVARTDLISVDPGDDTTLHVAQSGTYQITLCVDPIISSDAVVTPGIVSVRNAISVNTESEAPAAYTYLTGHGWISATNTVGGSTSVCIIQDLVVGDVIQSLHKAVQLTSNLTNPVLRLGSSTFGFLRIG